MDALKTIVDIMNDGENDSDRLKAAQDILNRAGMKQAQEIAVTHSNEVSPSELLMKKLEEIKPKQSEDLYDEDIIDAIEEDTPNDD